MGTDVNAGLFSLLPEPKSRWREFSFSYGIEVVAVSFVLTLSILRPQLITDTARNYKIISLVPTPPAVNHQPAPVRIIERPKVVAELKTPIPDNLRLIAPKPKPPLREEVAPKAELAAGKTPMLTDKPFIPHQLVRTNVFSTGSSAVPTIAAAPQKVQTGGFGDPNGVPASENRGRTVNIAQLGSFDLPAGPGYGNGTGGARGVKGVVSSAGFGNGLATGDGSGRISASRGTVRQGGFGDAEPVAAQARARVPDVGKPKLTPAEILSKPTPAYTEEARRLRIEGEVVLEVVFGASGKLHVVRVVRGLGHGLDENAVRAAEQIRFKPGLREGQPADSTAILHIIFQLA
ncbi:MAG TPA: energy transducer TonB [Terriglobales bacterium]|nr:energy transducer TonB [Terriglobales bacterium]